jgi:hypothetical protein
MSGCLSSSWAVKHPATEIGIPSSLAHTFRRVEQFQIGQFRLALKARELLRHEHDHEAIL